MLRVEWQPRSYAKAAVLVGADVQLSAVQRDPLAHSDQAAPASRVEAASSARRWFVTSMLI